MDDAKLRTKDFYTGTLHWDFDNTWTIREGEYPVFKLGTTDGLTPGGSGTTSAIYPLGGVYDLQGRSLHTFSLPGLYIADGKKVSMK